MFLYFCIEIFPREFDEQLILMDELTSDGKSVFAVFAIQNVLKYALANFPLPKGVVFVKSAQSYQEKTLSKIRSKGHRVVCQNAEFCITWSSNEQPDLEMISAQCVPHIDYLLAHNEFEKKSFLESFGSVLNPNVIQVSGSLRSQCNASLYKQYFLNYLSGTVRQHAPYILFCSSLGPNKLFAGKTDNQIIEHLINDGVRQDHAALLTAQYRYHSTMYERFATFLAKTKYLAKNSLDLVIRPHPSDDLDSLLNLFSSTKGVKLIGEGPVKPWILGSEATISSSSTTLAEAALLGVPAFSLLPGFPDADHSLIKFLREHPINNCCKQLHDLKDLDSIFEGAGRKFSASQVKGYKASARDLLGARDEKHLHALKKVISQNKYKGHARPSVAYINIAKLIGVILFVALLNSMQAVRMFVFQTRFKRQYHQSKNSNFSTDFFNKCSKAFAKQKSMTILRSARLVIGCFRL